MSITITCDYCGYSIDGPRIDLESDTRFTRGGWKTTGGNIAHFHNAEECYGPLREAIAVFLESRATLVAIPVLDEEPEIGKPEISGEESGTSSGVGCHIADPDQYDAGCRIDPDLYDALWARSIKTRSDFDHYVEERQMPLVRLHQLRLEGDIRRRDDILRRYEEGLREVAVDIELLAGIQIDTGLRNALIRAGVLTRGQLVTLFYGGAFARRDLPGIGNARVREIGRIVRDLMSPAEREFDDALEGLLPAIGRRALLRADVRTFEQAAATPEEELLAINGLSRASVQALRKAIKARHGEQVSVDAGS